MGSVQHAPGGRFNKMVIKVMKTRTTAKSGGAPRPDVAHENTHAAARRTKAVDRGAVQANRGEPSQLHLRWTVQAGPTELAYLHAMLVHWPGKPGQQRKRGRMPCLTA